MEKMTVGLFVLAICISGFGQNKDVADVKAAQEALWQAQQKADMRTVVSYLNDDLVGTHSNGTLSGKADVKAPPANPAAKPAQLQIKDLKLYESAALLLGEAVWQSQPPRTRSAIWIKEGGKWKEVAVHLTIQGDKPPEQPVALNPAISEKRNVSGAEQAVRQAHQAIEEAYAKKNPTRYEALTTAEFIRISSNGSVRSKAEALKAIQLGPTPSKISDFDDLKIRVHGDAAVLTAKVLGYPASGTPAAPQRMTRLFVKQGGKWLVALTQTCFIRQQ
jgi:ketosteroid isomerase-like protein